MELLKKINDNSVVIAIIGLGYVGLPLAVEFGKKYRVIGFDINAQRIEELKSGKDHTLEVNNEEFSESKYLCFTTCMEELKEADVFIITVPTPVDNYKRPDLTPLLRASETVGKVLKKGAIVVYESTVYPGCTEEDCVPVIEKYSKLNFNIDFYCGYSPERINPGDKEHRVNTIKKVVSGSTDEVGIALNELYKSIIIAGTHLAPSIKVAEAAKVIENTQRDINIAFVNELAMLFEMMDIDTLEVLEAAGTKWNFLPFRPGLVGGHCIGVDPYYLTHKANAIGYHPEMILAGRRINDGMGAYVARQLIREMIKNEHKINNAKVLILGITFKENCPDIRNSRVIDIITELISFGCKVDVIDPWANKEEVNKEYNIELIQEIKNEDQYSGIIMAVAHDQFKEIDYSNLKKNGAIIYDVKSYLNKELVENRL